MILYHGTNADFGEIDLRKSKPNKDFGQGFYLSREYIQAMEMAKIKVEQLETGFPTVLTFEADDEAMAELKVLHFDDYTEEWAKFILLNRNNASHKPAHDYDIVIGLMTVWVCNSGNTRTKASTCRRSYTTCAT
jgi:hypothetical protein